MASFKDMKSRKLEAAVSAQIEKELTQEPEVSEDELFVLADYDEMARRYDPTTLQYGYNTLPDGEEVYFIPNPALGLWINREKF